jgi:hypothetical protein
MTHMNRRPRVVPVAAAAAVITALTMGGLAGCATATGEQSAGASGTAAVSMTAMHQGNMPTAEEIGLYTTMTQLWAQHMEWTYATVLAFAQDAPDLQASLNRLLANQADLGNAIEPFYGNEAADQLTDLLTEHIHGALPVLTAAKAGDTAALQTALDAWYANAHDIADFLADANPHWKKADTEQMMRDHITQTVAYATDLLTGDYTKAITDYGIAEQHMYDMADMLSAGLIKQFPKSFR